MASNVPALSSRKKNAKINPLNFMTEHSRLVSSFRPVQPVSDPSAPKLILLATWMDARKAHIAKYVIQYQSLYPTASILLVRSSFACHLKPRSAVKALRPAVSFIQQELSSAEDDDTKSRMLVHMFSNGGSCMMYHLYNVYAKHATRDTMKIPTGGKRSQILPRHLGIYDSAPGGWDYQPSTSAVLHSLPAGLTRQLAFPFIHVVGAYWWVKYRGLRVDEETVVWGLAHNSAANSRETGRVYIYSEADKMVNFRDVEAHIDDATAKGFEITRNVKLLDSEHVAHARSYPELYWETIREAWNTQWTGR
ncbi:hypothetical protein EKO04_001173 [Ascochyta lentis]|uniref:Uncharacterized protein n=1 Tax=Ascochyta lentis TaxID=205686 RepID=A0A8H7MN17_9PLEO|nr:hypothetical protein EKO04_001173 [Ascochyta lentis]